jgi:SAM-dependent methyltransferase
VLLANDLGDDRERASGFPPLIVATFMALVTTHPRRDPVYVMGRSEDETRRLEERAKFFEPLTRHLFQDAGICAGMRILDMGSGAGDVSFLVADLVGPTGSVVGVDVNPDVIRTASTRAQARGLTFGTAPCAFSRTRSLPRDERRCTCVVRPSFAAAPIAGPVCQ